MNQCDGCVECCIGYPLLPDPDFWPEGKHSQEPCRFLNRTCDGCSIHAQPRPSVCTDFECAYIFYDLPKMFWPKTCKVVMTNVPMRVVFQKHVPPVLDPETTVLTLTETAPRAALGLDANKLRYWLGKKRGAVPPWACVHTHDIDLLSPPGSFQMRVWEAGKFVATWKDDDEYAEELYRWWTRY